jgi:septal ring factor EnvC (AmiA/AmiB activator)
MTLTLTNEEKAAVVTQHIKNVEYSIYNLELSVIEENSVSSPDATKISSLNGQIEDLEAQKTALNAELATLSA